MLIMVAYRIAGYQISSTANWIGTERWDIEAKTEGVQERLPPDEFVRLLKRLLEDRFQLKGISTTGKCRFTSWSPPGDRLRPDQP
jgi:uncharacterized protein (TIGR03435 family)